MNRTAYTVVALMRDERMGRTYEVARERDGGLIVRDTRVGSKGWEHVHPTLNPTLDIYLERCSNNFGYTVERVSTDA